VRKRVSRLRLRLRQLPHVRVTTRDRGLRVMMMRMKRCL
jgi:hypothetical protein